jgi:hypothetical protein
MNEFNALLIFVVLIMLFSLPLMIWAGEDGMSNRAIEKFLENDDD